MKYLTPLLIFLPILTSAQQPGDFRGLVSIFIDVISLLIPLIFGITLVVLLWGITKAWILNAGNETEVENGKRLALVGIIVLVIMSGIWGILAILRQSFFG